MDIVYTLGRGSKHNNSELKYSLRSVEKHLKGYDRIILVGECPHWIRKVIHLPYPDETNRPDYNIMRKIEFVCDYWNSPLRLSSNFLFMNDDHYFLSDFHCDTFPNFAKGDLEKMMPKGGGEYTLRLQTTLSALKAKGCTTHHFDIHTPIVYNKALFLQTMRKFNWDTQTFVIKSLYGNINNLEPTYMPDKKTCVVEQLTDAKIFSTPDVIPNPMAQFLKSTYPYPSIYE